MGDVVRRASGLVLEFDADGELSLYRTGSEQAVVLNATASEIWRLTEKHESVEVVVGSLAAAYGVGPDVIRPHVESAISALCAAGLLEMPSAHPHGGDTDLA